MADGIAKFTMVKALTGRTFEAYQLLSNGEGVIWLESREFDLGNPRDIKFLDLLWLTLDKYSPSLEIRLGYRDNPEDDVEWKQLEMDGGKAYAAVAARYFRIRVYDVAPKEVWKLTQIDFYGQIEGGMFT